MRKFSHLTALIVILTAESSWASNFGVVGLLTAPSARQMNDGVIAATISSSEVVNLFNISFQATPWLEAVFRYSDFDPYGRWSSFRFSALDPEGEWLSDGAPPDRSYELKARILKESRLAPAVAIGVRDLLGTGIWGGEYVVASKRLGKFDASLGLGWGRFASRYSIASPLRFIDDEWGSRPTTDGGEFGGELRLKSFFRGPVGVFGGLEYALEKYPISFLFEISGDNFERERSYGLGDFRSSINAGVKWSPNRSLSLTASHHQGRYLGITLRASGDFKSSSVRPPPLFHSVLSYEGASKAPRFLDLRKWYDRLLFDVERGGLRLYSAHGRPGSDTITFVIGNDRFAETGDAVRQFLSTAELHLEDYVRVVNIQLRENELLAPTITYIRPRYGPLTRAISEEAIANSLLKIKPSQELNRPSHKTDFGFPKLALGADSALRLQLMDPNEPVKHQVYVKGTARLALTEALNLWSSYSIDINNTFNTNRESNSALPKVRTELNRYLTEGASGVDSFFLEYKKSLNRDLHTRFYLGNVEEMFGGVGSEILFEPYGLRLAFGANVNWVAQRSFQKNFQYRDYRVFTGHFSMFYASPFYNLDLGIHAGRYLAGDTGYTIEARRTFDNGFSVGLFFTRTNVSAEDFGEGSFDKGLYFRIPFNFLFPINTRASYSTIIRTIERDGGRRLEGGVGSLWWDRRSVRPDSLMRQKLRMLP